MDRRWLPLNALRAFEAAGRAGSFTGASQVLLVTQSAVSRHVIALEEFLGTPLFERKRQSLVLTEAGQQLYPAVSKSFDRIDTVLDAIIQRPGPHRAILAVYLPPTFALQLAVPILSDFRAAFPDISLEIRTLGSGNVQQLGRNAVSVVFSEPRVSEHIRDLLWSIRMTPVCHPDLAAEAEVKGLQGFLEAHDLIHVAIEGRPSTYSWDIFTRMAGCHGVDTSRGLVFDTAQLALEYALTGKGIALFDPELFAREFAAGRLARPFDAAVPDGYGYYLIVSPEELENPVVSAFRTWLLNRFGAQAAAKTEASAS